MFSDPDSCDSVSSTSSPLRHSSLVMPRPERSVFFPEHRPPHLRSPSNGSSGSLDWRIPFTSWRAPPPLRESPIRDRRGFDSVDEQTGLLSARKMRACPSKLQSGGVAWVFQEEATGSARYLEPAWAFFTGNIYVITMIFIAGLLIFTCAYVVHIDLGPPDGTGHESWPASAVLAITFLVMSLLSSYRSELVFSIAALAIWLLGIIDQRGVYSGLRNTGTGISLLLIPLGEGFLRLQDVSSFVLFLLGRPRNRRIAVLRLVLVTVGLSAFLNNACVIKLLLPMVEMWAGAIQMPVSYFLMPLSFAAMAGGVLTQIGSFATVFALAPPVSKICGEGPLLAFFGVGAVGSMLVIIMAMYMAVAFGILTDTTDQLVDTRSSTGPYLTYYSSFCYEVPFRCEAPLLGMTVDQARLNRRPEVSQIKHRGGDLARSSWARHVLTADDIVVFCASAAGIAEIRKTPGLVLLNRYVHMLPGLAHERQLAEVIIDRRSLVASGTISRACFLQRFNAAVVGICKQPFDMVDDPDSVMRTPKVITPFRTRNSRANSEVLTPTTPDRQSDSGDDAFDRLYDAMVADTILRPGLALLLEVHPHFAEEQQHATDFAMVAMTKDSVPPSREGGKGVVRSSGCAAAMALMLAFAAAGVLPLEKGLTLVLFFFVMVSVIQLSDISRLALGYGGQIVTAVAAFSLSSALETTNIAHWLATLVHALCGGRPLPAFYLVYLITSIVCTIFEDVAVVVLLAPIWASMWRLVDHRSTPCLLPLLYLTIYATSHQFCNPKAQTNRMVAGRAAYNSMDFVFFGAPLQLMMFLLTPLLVYCINGAP
eukprot:EG_transcript_3330